MILASVSLELAAPHIEVFSFLADLNNWPKWANELLPDRLRRHYQAVRSRTTYSIKSDPGTGVIDVLVGSMKQPRYHLLTARVLECPSGGTLLLFTLFQPPQLTFEQFKRMYLSLHHELEGLKREISTLRMAEN